MSVSYSPNVIYTTVMKKLKEFDQRISDQDNKITLLKALGGGDGKGPDLDSLINALQVMVENLRKECYAQFAERDEHRTLQSKVRNLDEKTNDINKRLDNLDNGIFQCRSITDTNNMDIQDIKKKLNGLGGKSDSEDILRRLAQLEKSVQGKLDCDLFDSELSIIKEVLAHLE